MKKISDADVNKFLNRLAAMNGFRRESWGAKKYFTIGLRGPQGTFICSLMSALRHLAVRGVLPKFVEPEPKPKRTKAMKEAT